MLDKGLELNLNPISDIDLSPSFSNNSKVYDASLSYSPISPYTFENKDTKFSISLLSGAYYYIWLENYCIKT